MCEGKQKSQESNEYVRNTSRKSDVWELGGESIYEDRRLTVGEMDIKARKPECQENKAGCIEGVSFVPSTKYKRTRP